MKEMILKKNSVRTSIPCDVMLVCREPSCPSLFSSPFHFFDLFSFSPHPSLTHSLPPVLTVFDKRRLLCLVVLTSLLSSIVD